MKEKKYKKSGIVLDLNEENTEKEKNKINMENAVKKNRGVNNDCSI
jgi:hypothetical protein